MKLELVLDNDTGEGEEAGNSAPALDMRVTNLCRPVGVSLPASPERVALWPVFGEAPDSVLLVRRLSMGRTPFLLSPGDMAKVETTGLPELDLLAVAELEDDVVIVELLFATGNPLLSDPDPVLSLGAS